MVSTEINLVERSHAVESEDHVKNGHATNANSNAASKGLLARAWNWVVGNDNAAPALAMAAA